MPFAKIYSKQLYREKNASIIEVNGEIDALQNKTANVTAAGVETLLSGDLNMNSNIIKNVADPVNEQDAVTLKYYDDNLPAPVDITGKLSLDGLLPMTGNLNMGGNALTNVQTLTSSGNLNITVGTKNLLATPNYIRPNGTYDLGLFSSKFRDVHLSGKAYVDVFIW